MKKRELRARIAELEGEVKRLKLELHMARLNPSVYPIVVPEYPYPSKRPWENGPWGTPTTAPERTSPGDGITWIQPVTTSDGAIRIYSNDGAS
jgi:hypothetical protein